MKKIQMIYFIKDVKVRCKLNILNEYKIEEIN